MFHKKATNEKISGSSWNINERARKGWRRTIIQIPREYILIITRVIPHIGTDDVVASKSLRRYRNPTNLAKPKREYGIERLLIVSGVR